MFFFPCFETFLHLEVSRFALESFHLNRKLKKRDYCNPEKRANLQNQNTEALGFKNNLNVYIKVYIKDLYFGRKLEFFYRS